jgi:hypothetical protein
VSLENLLKIGQLKPHPADTRRPCTEPVSICDRFALHKRRGRPRGRQKLTCIDNGQSLYMFDSTCIAVCDDTVRWQLESPCGLFIPRQNV